MTIPSNNPSVLFKYFCRNLDGIIVFILACVDSIVPFSNETTSRDPASNTLASTHGLSLPMTRKRPFFYMWGMF